MALVENTKNYAVDLTGGRMLNPGAQATVDVTQPHEDALVQVGVLRVVDGDVEPPTPDTTEVPVRGVVPWAPTPDPFVIHLLTQDDYDAIADPDPSTLYVIQG